MDSSWKSVLSQGGLAGTLAALTSTAVLLAAGKRDNGSAAAPVNAVSHWYWGDEALHRDDADLAHTAMGYLTHHGASVFWAMTYASLCRHRPASRTLKGVTTGALATSAVACFVDYCLTPKRFTPGYEHRLSIPPLAAVYASFALGLGAGALAMRKHYPVPNEAPRCQSGDTQDATGGEANARSMVDTRW